MLNESCVPSCTLLVIYSFPLNCDKISFAIIIPIPILLTLSLNSSESINSINYDSTFKSTSFLKNFTRLSLTYSAIINFLSVKMKVKSSSCSSKVTSQMISPIPIIINPQTTFELTYITLFKSVFNFARFIINSKLILAFFEISTCTVLIYFSSLQKWSLLIFLLFF